MIRRLFAAAALLSTVTAAQAQGSAAPAPLPRLVDAHGARQLEVDGRPFLMLGGELANSSASDRGYMAARWPALAAMNVNTVLMPVSWELIEPAEGRFDFAMVDGLLADARAAKLRVVILWFGSWKNSMSSYAPAWVKRDERRFPRARTADGTPLEILSPFVPANATADARAFAALMRHLKQADPQRTVLMVQVENEIGMIPEARDRSAAADRAFAAPLPAALGRRGSWTQAYGTGADEAFMAWHFARYTDVVAQAGRREYGIPLYVNAALPRPTAVPGKGYPAAGPLPHLAELWTKGAPTIDFLAPDIYYPNFVEWTRRYAALPRNPLFIPEAGQSGAADATGNALFAIGALDAMGFSPFSIDTIPAEGGARLASLYRLLDGLSPLILARQGTDRLWGARAPIAFDGTADLADQTTVMAGYRLSLRFTDPWTPKEKQQPAEHGAIVLATGEGEYLIAGRGVTVTFAPADGRGVAGIEAADEGRMEAGRFLAERRMNGDQTHQGRHVRLPPEEFTVQRVKLYRYR
ncbi:DUF5597 domain-containing protein [Sphingomonas corticis]|jgi:beta-galactosidase GanA|uniref:DUF5597 domain-containing protein n=1 Tax=Sphingomonas corticis TaxID=2722791 RepID=A0ABX1CP47_9SPHN|nr:DUF5597 domain-containing protein [Sphingomonas corticis]NJR78142.1 DUF5597 domain-containing protein [Sphingomonas corticis]